MTARTSRCNAWLITMLIWVYVDAGSYDATSRINDVLKNETALRYYVKCFLDKGPCSGEARLMKRLIPEFVSTSCGRCSRKQKQISCRVLATLQQEQYSELWDDILVRYDPDEVYRTNLTEYMNFCSDEFKILI